jgi:hypothetical protein
VELLYLSVTLDLLLEEESESNYGCPLSMASESMKGIPLNIDKTIQLASIIRDHIEITGG